MPCPSGRRPPFCFGDGKSGSLKPAAFAVRIELPEPVLPVFVGREIDAAETEPEGAHQLAASGSDLGWNVTGAPVGWRPQAPVERLWRRGRCDPLCRQNTVAYDRLSHRARVNAALKSDRSGSKPSRLR